MLKSSSLLVSFPGKNTAAPEYGDEAKHENKCYQVYNALGDDCKSYWMDLMHWRHRAAMLGVKAIAL